MKRCALSLLRRLAPSDVAEELNKEARSRLMPLQIVAASLKPNFWLVSYDQDAIGQQGTLLIRSGAV